jgi:acetylornithine deacetylase
MRRVAPNAGIASSRSARRRVPPPAPTIRRCCSPGRLAEAEATTLVAFGTEAGLFQRVGIPTVVCGPGHIAQAHQADEYVSLAQLAAGGASCRAHDGRGRGTGRDASASNGG